MSACVRQREEELAFSLYQQMLVGSSSSAAAAAAPPSASTSSVVRPDELTYLILLGACAGLPSLQGGEYFHACIIDAGYGGEARLANALINMYGKCGDAHAAARAFQRLLPSSCTCCYCYHDDDIVGWTALIASYAQQGDARAALGLAACMLLDHRCRGPEPSPISFLAVMSACSHAGLIHDACSCFMLMCDRMQQHNNSMRWPAIEHFVCLIDLLARAGRTEEASAIAASSSLDSHAYASSALDRALPTHPSIGPSMGLLL
jgi:pentatricopeptide repeat protein